MWIGHRSKRPSYTSSQSESWLVYSEVVTTVTLAGLIIANRMSCSSPSQSLTSVASVISLSPKTADQSQQGARGWMVCKVVVEPKLKVFQRPPPWSDPPS
ncbi:unnamed protein product [Arctogadus glacialis]